MKFKKLEIDNKIFHEEWKIHKILEDNGFNWLIDSEIENADISILNKTIIWNSGSFYSGNWYYGIWKDGDFYGIWENGIWEGGVFSGKFESGIRKK